ncbi:unnamed protein product [Mytilus coruscus]|uniref:Fibronectin type-III domain-containing protein n=1 Tax=Mytilus coruscus TaxID=42192 RepID=A0A6J8BPC0_MYTCO|nr:unnamed protein product [Mytilus coruscus]
MTCTAKCTFSSITLDWSSQKSTDESEIDGYTVKYRIKGDKRFTIKQIDDPSENTVFLDGLKSDTDYEIKVYASVDGDESLFFEKKVTTEISMARSLLLLSKKKDKEDGKLDIYQMEPESITILAKDVRRCDMISGYDDDKHVEKTIMLLGATGSGKSTQIDAMFNYIAGVSFVDDYRFELVHLTKEEEDKLGKQYVSQTNGITCYRIPWKDDSSIKCKLCVIDSPGFGDSRGEEFDKTIPEKVKNLFQRGIRSLDALCLVVPVSCTRLTDPQKYVFSSILELFAKDISDNIFIFLTYDDGAAGYPVALGALREADIPFKEDMYFRFNNANVFKTEHSDDVWRKRNNSFSRFFDKLMTLPSVSLSSTKEVLDSTAFLEIQLANIQKTIGDQVIDIMNIKEDKQFIENNEKDIESNKNFTKTVQVKEPIIESHSYASLNCVSCQKTCHLGCWVVGSWLIWTCEVMSESRCRVCRCRCGTETHALQYFTHETKTVTKTETLEELKRRYDVAKEGAEGRKDIMDKNRASLKKSLEELNGIIKQVDENIEKLRTKAVKPKIKSMDEYLDNVIAKVKDSTVDKTNYERVQILQNVKKAVSSKTSLTDLVTDI